MIGQKARVESLFYAAVFLNLILTVSGCGHPTIMMRSDAQIASPPSLLAPPVKLPAFEQKALDSEDLLSRLDSLTLIDVVSIALHNNPQTKSAWAEAQAAAMNYGAERASYLPVITADGTLNRSKQLSSPLAPAAAQTTYGPSASISYLLFDFGGREGSVANARALMLSSEFLYNAVVQDMVLTVETAYFRYMAIKSLLEAESINLKEAQTNLGAAKKRHEVGLATIADVLQAQTVFSRAQLRHQQTAGDIEITKGALALSMGLPANTPYDLVSIPKEIPFTELNQSIEELIEQAIQNRPDLQAEKARVLAAQAHVRDIRAEGMPSFKISGTLGRTYFDQDFPDIEDYSDYYSGGFSLHLPLFSGYKHMYDTRQAIRQAEAESARAESLEQQVIYQVFSAYNALKTATQQIVTSEDLLKSAQLSEEVALARYKEGVGSIIDLLSAQSLLAEARSQQIQSRWTWFTVLAQLARNTGLLSPTGENPFVGKIQ